MSASSLGLSGEFEGGMAIRGETTILLTVPREMSFHYDDCGVSSGCEHLKSILYNPNPSHLGGPRL